MSFIAAKWGDPVIGVDIHLVMVPTPAGPVPTPLPHPFIGIVFDPVGAALGAAIGKAMGGGAWCSSTACRRAPQGRPYAP